jgi:hypothetical protein
VTDPLMSREEVADHLGIPLENVRKVMSRAGIPHQSGWPRDLVEKLHRPGKGWRTDLHGPRPTEEQP